MADELPTVTAKSRVEFLLRLAWIAVRLLLAFYLGHKDSFFYQGF